MDNYLKNSDQCPKEAVEILTIADHVIIDFLTKFTAKQIHSEDTFILIFVFSIMSHTLSIFQFEKIKLSKELEPNYKYN